MGTTSEGRLVSLDALRGFVVLVMIFVNDVASVAGLPWWMYHIPPGAFGLTFVDVVYPAFLFMVGTAIPLALERRRREGMSPGALARHVALRGVALSVIGLLQMNGRELDPVASGVPYALWNAAVLSAMILAWTQDPQAEGRRARVLRLLRLVSIAVLVVLVALYRSKHGGWLHFGNRGILGSIGAAYVVAAGLHAWTRRTWAGAIAAFVSLVLWNVGTRVGVTPLPIVGNGAAASVVMAGVLACRWLQSAPRAQSAQAVQPAPPAQWVAVARRAMALGGFAAAMTLAAIALAPRFHVAKIGATPSWCLYSAAITTVLLIFFYMAIDVRGWIAWAGPLLPAGRNALVVYLLPDIFYAIFGVKWLDAWLGHGGLGVLRAVVFTAAMMAWGALLTRHRIRMQL
jgi:predicted acyltransferase